MTIFSLLLLVPLNATQPIPPASQQRALGLLQQVCDGGSRLACAHLGRLYERGQGVARDESRAVRLYRRACVAGSRFGCDQLRKVCGAAPRPLEAKRHSLAKRSSPALRKACGATGDDGEDDSQTTEASIVSAWSSAAPG